MTERAPRTIRFRHITDEGEIYVGEAEITTEKDEDQTELVEATILSCWLFGTTIEQVEPYDTSFPIRLRRQIERTAREQRHTPPASPVELPSDWDGIEVVDVSTRYTIRTKMILPRVETPYQKKLYGLNTIQALFPDGLGNYMVIAKGGLTDVHGEMQRLAAL